MRIALIGVVLLAAAIAAPWMVPPDAVAVVRIAALLVFVALLARGIFSVRSSLVERTVWRSSDAGDLRVSLTFDDGPDPVGTARILDVLRDRKVRATFFVVGSRVRAHAELAQRILAEGHEIGCHSDTHSRWTPFLRGARLRAELTAGLDAVRKAVGVTPRFYRPPFGFRSPANVGAASNLDLLVVGMARRGHDQSPEMTAERLAARVTASVGGGDILALHDGDEPRPHHGAATGEARRCVAADALPAILDGFASRGLIPVTVGELLAERAYRESPERPWTGRTRGGRWGNGFFSWTVRRLGPVPAAICVLPVSLWFVVAAGPARRASIELRRRIHGSASILRELWWAWRHFFVYGRTLLQRVAHAHGRSSNAVIERVGWDSVSGIVHQPGGVLLLSAHFGEWASAGRAFGTEHRELSVLAFRGTGVGAHAVKGQGGSSFRTIDVTAPPAAVATEIAAALLKGGAVAALADRAMNDDVVRAPFLGGEITLPRGLWKVAMVARVPVVVVLAVPTGRDRFTIYFDGPILLSRASGADREAVVANAAARYAAFLEACVRKHPFHWANFFDVWSTK